MITVGVQASSSASCAYKGWMIELISIPKPSNDNDKTPIIKLR